MGRQGGLGCVYVCFIWWTVNDTDGERQMGEGKDRVNKSAKGNSLSR